MNQEINDIGVELFLRGEKKLAMQVLIANDPQLKVALLESATTALMTSVGIVLGLGEGSIMSAGTTLLNILRPWRWGSVGNEIKDALFFIPRFFRTLVKTVMDPTLSLAPGTPTWTWDILTIDRSLVDLAGKMGGLIASVVTIAVVSATLLWAAYKIGSKVARAINALVRKITGKDFLAARARARGWWLSLPGKMKVQVLAALILTGKKLRGKSLPDSAYQETVQKPSMKAPDAA